MKSRLLLVFLIFCCAQIFWGGEVWGQTYTTTGNSTDWNSATAWVRTNPNGNPNITLTGNTPPVGGAPYYPYTSPVVIVINHPINYTGGNTSIGGGSYSSLTINSGGNLSFNGNLGINNAGGNLFSIHLNGTGKMKVTGTLIIRAGAKLTTSNNSNQSPNAIVEVGNLTLESSGSGHEVNIGANTTFKVNGITNLQGGGGINLQGNMSSNSFTSSSSGGLFFNMTGDGKLDVATSFYQGGFPLNTSNNSQINIAGNYTLFNAGANETNIRNNSSFYVGGTTDISETFQAYDQAIITFGGNVNVSNGSSSILSTYNSADMLIKGNLSTTNVTSGTVSSNNQSSIVICGSRDELPAGSTGGTFPPVSNANISQNGSSYYGGCRILPVEFLSFTPTYQSQAKSAVLSWSTAKEWENSHFEIERAVNSVKTWESVGRVEGHGYSDAPVDYNFTDTELPKSGGNVFYRLKQVDYSGKYSYSDTRAIHLPLLESELRWVAYPNPSNGYNIQLASPGNAAFTEETPIQFSLSTSMGQYERIPGKTLGEINQNLSSSLGQKSAGLYLLIIQWGTNQQTLRIIKI